MGGNSKAPLYQWLFLVPVKGGIGGIVHPLIGSIYHLYILPSAGPHMLPIPPFTGTRNNHRLYEGILDNPARSRIEASYPEDFFVHLSFGYTPEFQSQRGLVYTFVGSEIPYHNLHLWLLPGGGVDPMYPILPHRIHVWYIYSTHIWWKFYGKCRKIYQKLDPMGTILDLFRNTNPQGEKDRWLSKSTKRPDLYVPGSINSLYWG